MRKHLIIASLILAFETWIGVAVIGMGCGMLFVPVFLILAITEKQRRSEWLRATAAYALLFFATMGVILSNWGLAQRRAEPVISAVNRYHSERGRYPKTLDELVPSYLPSIPRAGYTVLSRDFRYYNDRPQLCIVVMMHGISAYDFPTETWRTNE
jgi:hypothetical protein